MRKFTYSEYNIIIINYAIIIITNIYYSHALFTKSTRKHNYMFVQ